MALARLLIGSSFEQVKLLAGIWEICEIVPKYACVGKNRLAVAMWQVCSMQVQCTMMQEVKSKHAKQFQEWFIYEW